MHSHDHAHGHSHDHDGSNFRIGIAFVLNFCFTIVEFIGGWLTNSTAIMADAVHDLGDTLSIGTAWMLGWLGRRPADHDGALVNGLVLVGGSVWVLSEAIPRLADPVMPATEGMLRLAIFGAIVNGYAAYRLSKGKTLNERVLN